MDVKATLHSSSSLRRNLERRHSSVTLIRNSTKFSPTLRRIKSEPAINFPPLNPSRESSFAPLSPFNGMHNSLHANDKASHILNFSAMENLTEIKREIKRICRLMETLYSKRLQLKERRNESRQERGVLVELDAEFMKSVREGRSETLEKDFDRLDLQRDKVGELQYDYDLAEDEYDAVENSLDKEEQRLIQLLNKFLPKDSDDDDSSMSASYNGGLQLQQPPEPDLYDEQQIRLKDYQSRIGDARIMQERLQEMTFERERRLSFSRKRGIYNMTHDVSDEGLTDQLNATAEELYFIKVDVQRLEEALQKDGLLNFSSIEISEPTPAFSDGSDQLHNQPENLPVQMRRPASFSSIEPPEPIPTLSDGSDQLRNQPKSLFVHVERPVNDSIMPKDQESVSRAQAWISFWILLRVGNSPILRIIHQEFVLKVEKLEDKVSADKPLPHLAFESWEQYGETSSIGSWAEIPREDLPEYKDFPKFSTKAEVEGTFNEYKQNFPPSDGSPVDPEYGCSSVLSLEEL